MAKVELDYLHEFIDRHGKPRCYFRYKGRKQRLPLRGHPDFFIEYAKNLAAINQPVPVPHNVAFIKGTVAWVIDQYRDHDEFKTLARGTKRTYGRCLDIIRMETGDCLFRDFTQMNVRALRDRVKQTHAPSTADRVVSLVGILWGFAPEFCQLPLGANPTTDVANVYTPGVGHLPWPQEVIDRFYAAAKQRLRTALSLLLYTGQRGSDVVKMKWTDIVIRPGKGGAEHRLIRVKQQKTMEGTDEYLLIPIHRRLWEELEAAPRTNEYIVNSARGRPYGDPSYLSTALDLVLARVGGEGYTMHGLRSNSGIALAEVGCSEKQIMAILGHKTSHMAQKYIRQANQARLAIQAIRQLEDAAAEDLPGIGHSSLRMSG